MREQIPQAGFEPADALNFLRMFDREDNPAGRERKHAALRLVRQVAEAKASLKDAGRGRPATRPRIVVNQEPEPASPKRAAAKARNMAQDPNAGKPAWHSRPPATSLALPKTTRTRPSESSVGDGSRSGWTIKDFFPAGGDYRDL